MASQQQKSQEIPLNQLKPQQLMQVRKQTEEEIQMLNQNMQQLKTAIQKYEDNKNILNSLKTSKVGSDLLIPITTSLFVPGSLQDNNKVIVDYGTGFYVERNPDQAKNYCNDIQDVLKQNVQKLNDVVAQKANLLEKVNLEVQRQFAANQAELKQQQKGQGQQSN